MRGHNHSDCLSSVNARWTSTALLSSSVRLNVKGDSMPETRIEPVPCKNLNSNKSGSFAPTCDVAFQPQKSLWERQSCLYVKGTHIHARKTVSIPVAGEFILTP